MSKPVKIFVNEKSLEIEPGTSVEAAVGEFDEKLGAALSAATAYVTDGVGRRLDLATVVYDGAILRVVGRGSRAGQ